MLFVASTPEKKSMPDSLSFQVVAAKCCQFFFFSDINISFIIYS